MAKGPGLYTEIGKQARDLLAKDYTYDHKFALATCTDAGLAITSTALKKGGISTADVSAQYKYKDHIFNVKVDTESNISTTLSFQELLPNTKAIATLKFPDYNSGKIEAQYFHENATLTGAVALKQSPAIDLSATIGTPSFAFGAEASYETKLGNFTKYNAGISVTTPEYNISLILDKGDTVRASCLRYWDVLKRGAAVAELSRTISTNENTFTVGTSYAVDSLTSVKAKLNNHGKIGALLLHEVKPKSILTISCEVDTKNLDKNPRFGLALSLKP